MHSFNSELVVIFKWQEWKALELTRRSIDWAHFDHKVDSVIIKHIKLEGALIDKIHLYWYECW
jgi:hypothetical protein